MLVNPAKHTHVKKELCQQFIDWLISPEGQRVIAATRSTASSCFPMGVTVRLYPR
jgi:tungstate transport system substrate-binding protein